MKLVQYFTVRQTRVSKEPNCCCSSNKQKSRSVFLLTWLRLPRATLIRKAFHQSVHGPSTPAAAPADTAQLRALVQRFNYDWEAVGKALNRNPLECRSRYLGTCHITASCLEQRQCAGLGPGGGSPRSAVPATKPAALRSVLSLTSNQLSCPGCLRPSPPAWIRTRRFSVCLVPSAAPCLNPP